jgi:hypothetical protein
MDGYHVVRMAEYMDFYLFPDSIIAHVPDSAHRRLVESLLLGEIFSLWLELRGVCMIHASSMVINDEAIAFLSVSKGGKSSLAAAFMQKGYKLLTDDLLPVENRNDRFVARPGYPAMRMWPDQAEYFFGDYENLKCVQPDSLKLRIPAGPGGFGTFCPEEKLLKVMYVPERRSSGNDISIKPVSKKNAFFHLLRNSYSAGIVEALCLHPQRMHFFARMAMQVPVRELTYPEGYDHLSRVVDAVLDDGGFLHR